MRASHPHSDAMHTVEEFRRVDFGHMEIRVTIDDPKAYTRPWSFTMKFQIMPDTELIEDFCENEIRVQLNLNNDKEPHEDPLR